MKMDESSIKNGDKVKVLLHGDNTWYPGIVIKTKKKWVELDPNHYPFGNFIADESCIFKWKKIS